MERKRYNYAAKCAVIFAVVPILIYAYASGPDPRKTGAPGDRTCNEAGCHVGTALNGGGGKVEISYEGGSNYTPGLKQRFTVTITDSAARVYGFQASTRPSSNLTNGQAGTFSNISPATQVICEEGATRPTAGSCRASSPIEFIEHTSPQSSNVFTFDWTPPATAVGDIKVYVAANAANGNGQNTGDHIYTTNITLSPGASGPKPTISAGGVADGFTFQAGTAANAWTAIFGTNLAADTKTWDGDPAFAQGKLPSSLNGVGVTINGKAASVYFISPGQINVLAPSIDTAEGPVQVVVTSPNGNSDPVSITKSKVLPAFYAPFGKDGKLFVTAVQTSPASPVTLLGKVGVDPRVVRGVKPGEIILLYGTGFGATNPAVDSTQVVSGAPVLVTQPTIRFGDTVADVRFGGLVASGLYQFNVVVPNVPDGDVPLTAELGSVRSAATVLITIQK
jgi:uncharacterized protein (TIGR03437 family)